MENDQQKRLLIAIVLSTVLMFVWMEYFQPKPAPVQPHDAGAASLLAADAGLAAPAQPAAVGDGGVAAAEGPPVAAAPERTADFDTPAQQLVFSNKGGALQKAVIKNGGKWPERKFVARGNNEPIDMVRRRDGAPLPGATELKGELTLAAGATYELEQGKDQVTFRTATPEVALEKRYQINPDGYELRLDVNVTNRSAAPKKAILSVVYPAWVEPKSQQTGGFFSPPPEVSQVVCRHGGSNDTLAGGKSSSGPFSCGGGSEPEAVTKTFQGPVQFVGFDERYFGGLVFPRFGEGTSCQIYADPAGNREARLEVDLGTLAPGQTAKREFGMYLGPKALQELQRVTHANAIGAELTPVGEEPKPGGRTQWDPELNQSIDFGWMAVICRVLLEIMKIFQKAVVNWGAAIILLTVLVKVLLYPLSVKQMASMESMRKLQPQMDALSKKYENDKEKLNMERMKLFQENKVNPFGGCLPLLVQMPVWIALYRTLLTSFELYREPLVAFWITDLTAKDPYYIMPLAMGVTMFITQKMQPQMGDPTQAKVMLYFMPIFFTFLMLSLPAGLTLYIFTNNLLSIAQQKWLQRKFKMQAATPQTPQRK